MNKITRQSTSDDEFMYLLGLCQWVFNSNCSFIIEMIDKDHHNNSSEPWYKLIELTAGNLLNYKNKIISILGKSIYDLFAKLIDDRNCIIHSIPTGAKVDNYVMSISKDFSSIAYL